MEIPPQFKVLTTYIRRAEELDKDAANPQSAVIAYYCRMYAIHRGMKLGVPQNEMGFLLQLMDVVEKSPVAKKTSAAEGKVACENFALNVFRAADDEDRSPAGSTMSTGKSFYAASAFFDIIEQFGELEPDIAEKRRYSKWKAADIVKAIKEGRRPAAGGAEQDPAGAAGPASVSSSPPAPATASTSAMADIPAAPTSLPAPVPPALPMPGYSPAPAPAPVPAPAMPQHAYSAPAAPTALISARPAASFGGSSATGAPKNFTDPRAKDCAELATFAVAALKHNDINLARNRLVQALQMLE